MDTRFWWEIRRKMQLGRFRRRWEDNNKICVTEIEWGVTDWIRLENF
jgi:hypothetical protein